MAKTSDAKVDAAVASLREAQSKGALRLGNTLDRLASQIGAHADVRTVFGDAISQQGITVIPVARVIGAFGAGTGGGADASDAAPSGGIGAGGGFYATPVGFIEIDAGGARFRTLEGPLGPLSGPTDIALRLIVEGLRALVVLVQRRFS